MNFLMNDSLIKAVSWTLIHSLWLGLVTALLAALTVYLTKKSTAAIRYNLLAGLSVLFLVTAGFIFYNELETPETVSSTGKVVGSDIQSANFHSFPAVTAKIETNTPLSLMKTFIGNYGSWIVLAWFIIFMYKCFRMTAGFRQVYRARNYQTSSPPEIWQERLSELQTLLRIKRGVKLLESGLVTVPSVTGWLKPVILVPVGLLNNIPHDQVESILLHELAHIRRSDYLVNLMQTFVEILFFFNPGILWVSSLLKDERENCCDDLAISITNNKKEFVNALVSFQEYTLNTQQFTLQFGDKKMKLADRARRILFNNNKMLSTTEKYFLSAGIAITVVLFLVVANFNSSSAQEIVKPQLQDPGTAVLKNNGKDVPEGISIKYVDVVNGKECYTYIFKKDGVLYQVPETLENMKVDGKLIEGKEREKYLSKIKELIEIYEVSIASVETDEYPEIKEVDLSEEERIMNEASRIMDIHAAIIDKHAAIIDKEAAIIDQQTAIIDAEVNKKSGQIDWKKHDEAQRKIQVAQDKIHAESDKINLESDKINQESRKIEEQSRRIEAKLKLQEVEMRRVEAELRAKEAQNNNAKPEPVEEDITKAIISDLKQAGYKGKIHSFELSEKRLLINGKVQPAELFEKVKKYIKPGMRVLYNVEVN
ncbi:Methicillin resistance mecR1 protein [compost metagenome]